MSSKRPEFANGEIYHIYNRGVDKREIFNNDSDRFRFISSLLEFNKKESVKIRYCKDRFGLKRSANSAEGREGDKKLVDILAFCLMPNHYHLVLRQESDNGVSLFMQKIGNGYTGYFNKKHGRDGLGSLFQGKFKAVHVDKNDQFLNLVSYIFTNPLSIFDPGWKESGSSNPQEAVIFLNSYRWSSYLDCIGINNFPSVTDQEFIFNLFKDNIDNLIDNDENKDGPANEEVFESIKKAVEGWILYKSEMRTGTAQVADLLLEQ